MNSIISLEFSLAPVALSESAQDARAECITLAAGIESVHDAATQARAVEAQKAIRKLLADVEKARKTVKEPILEAGRILDKTVADFVEIIKDQELRIARLSGDYQQAELEKIRKAEQAAAAERDRIAREQAEAVAKAEAVAAAAHKAAAEIENAAARLAAEQAAAARLAAEKQRQSELAAQQTEAVPVVAAPAKASGQTVREEWEITRINEFALMRARPDLVRKVEFDTRSIKDELGRGLTLPGVEARKVIKSGVRVGRELLIEV